MARKFFRVSTATVQGCQFVGVDTATMQVYQLEPKMPLKSERPSAGGAMRPSQRGVLMQ
jgi:hypothetical protein